MEATFLRHLAGHPPTRSLTPPPPMTPCIPWRAVQPSPAPTLNAGRAGHAHGGGNRVDRTVQVAPTFHFHEANSALQSHREAARARLTSPPAQRSGLFEPGTNGSAILGASGAGPMSTASNGLVNGSARLNLLAQPFQARPLPHPLSQQNPNPYRMDRRAYAEPWPTTGDRRAGRYQSLILGGLEKDFNHLWARKVKCRPRGKCIRAGMGPGQTHPRRWRRPTR